MKTAQELQATLEQDGMWPEFVELCRASAIDPQEVLSGSRAMPAPTVRAAAWRAMMQPPYRWSAIRIANRWGVTRSTVSAAVRALTEKEATEVFGDAEQPNDKEGA